MIRLPRDLTELSETRLLALERSTWRELTRVVKRLRATTPNLDLAVRNSDAVEAEMTRRGIELPPVE